MIQYSVIIIIIPQRSWRVSNNKKDVRWKKQRCYTLKLRYGRFKSEIPIHILRVGGVAAVLLCLCRGFVCRVFPVRSGDHSRASIVLSTAEERVADSSRERGFVLQLHLKTQQKRKGHRRQFRLSCFVSTATSLWRAAPVLPVWLQVFWPTTLNDVTIWTYQKEPSYWFIKYWSRGAHADIFPSLNPVMEPSSSTNIINISKCLDFLFWMES